MTPPDRAPSREHIVPRSRGGSRGSRRNRAIVCEPCNADKGAMTLPEWCAALEAAGDPRAAHVVNFRRKRRKAKPLAAI